VAPVFDNLTLCERVYRHLRQEILADQLPPGTELSEVALSRELAVSRGPIREAMGRLAAEGLVTIRPRRGAEVRSLTPQELIDAYQVREALEVMAVRLAVPRITKSDLARLDELVTSMAEFARKDRVAEFFAANVAFHELLCQLSGNEKLREMHHRLEGEISRFQARTLALRGSLESSVSEHRAILAAVRLGDVDKAGELTAAHIRVPAQRLQESLDEGAQPIGSESQPPAVTPSGPRDLLEARSLVSSP
jgi:DNA-binding GntR family transcriptional regulator